MNKPYTTENTVVLSHDDLTTVKLTKNHLQREADGALSQRYIFLFDVSGSMAGSRLEASKKAAEELRSMLSNKNIAANENITNKFKVWDHVAIGSFDTSVKWLTKLNQANRNGKDDDRFQNQIGRLRIGGMTAVRDSIKYAYETIVQLDAQLSSFLNVPTDALQTHLFVLTDEEDNSSTTSENALARLTASHPNIHLNIVHIAGAPSPTFSTLCQHGRYIQITESREIVTTVIKIVELV